MKKSLPHWLKDRIPRYKKIEAIPQVFEDSTHQLWCLSGLEISGDDHFLKLCSNTESPFWEIMHDLFDFDLRQEIADFDKTYAFISEISSLKIPELIQAETLEDQGEAYILTSTLNAQAFKDEISDEMVKQLAEHLAQLHSNSSDTWGRLLKPNFDESEWKECLSHVLEKNNEKWGGVFLHSDKYLQQASSDISNIQATNFVPMMPDLRWDQFLQKDNKISALVDLDAFVYAPRELDFVILEYILSIDQEVIFKEAYSKHHAIPDIEQLRIPYRLLLFYMQILGETDLDEWMDKEFLF